MNSPVDWQSWIPAERATICFVVTGGQVLLIHKKRGLGSGKVNGPGGRLEPGETLEQCAIRETIEEIGVRPIAPERAGEVSFQFVDGYSLHCTLFIAHACEGTPIETVEATPFWCPVGQVPYENMWEDDRHWLPLLLGRQYFEGFFLFDGEAMQWMDLRNLGPMPPLPAHA